MTVALYLRKSRAEENEPAAITLSRHRDILTEYAQKTGLTIVCVYEEVVSGDSLYGRPEMIKLLENISAYEAVLCMDIDRLGRGAMHEQGLIFEAFRAAGVLIITPGKTYDLSDDTDDSLIGFKALFAREEYKMIRGRLRRGTLKAVQEGCYLSNAPFGYKQVRVNKKPTLEIVPEEAEGIRLIYRLYCEGQGCQAISDTLHALGYRPRRGQKFNRTTVAKIIRNPVYIGMVAWNQACYERSKQPDQKRKRKIKPREDWIITEGLHEAIIDKPLYDKANQMMQGRYHPPYNKGVVKNPFAGILYCDQCGMSMVRQPLQNKQYSQPILICPTAGCMMSSSLELVEKIMYAAIENSLIAISSQTEAETPAAPSAVDMAETARAELGRLRQQDSRLHDLLEQGVYNIDTFIARRNELQARIDAANSIINRGEVAISRNTLIHRLKSVLEHYWKGSPYERNQILKSTIQRAVYRKPKGSGWGSNPVIEITRWEN